MAGDIGTLLRVIRIASLSSKTSPKIVKPAARRVPPVDTTSAITSATPRRIELSTAPSRRTIEALIFFEAKKLSSKPGYAVAIRLFCKSASPILAPEVAANLKVLLPKSSGRTSEAPAPESRRRSLPVIPASSSPLPT